MNDYFEYFEIECPCSFIEEGLIDSCKECPYVEDEESEEIE